MNAARLRACLLALLALAPFQGGAAGLPPLTRAHAHNDYEHEHPLTDALSHGFWSVEADIWLTNGQLLVAHDFDQALLERTLQRLYLDPMRRFVLTNRAAIASAGPMTLLVDIKSDATNTWLALRDVLGKYSYVLTRFDSNAIHTNSITVILSGNRATPMLAGESPRYAAIDGRLPDLDLGLPAALVPMVSDNWTKQFKWRGQGALPAAEHDKLRAIVARAHEQGRRVRLWAAPDTPAGWRELLACGVDLLNTDHLAEMETFLRAQ